MASTTLDECSLFVLMYDMRSPRPRLTFLSLAILAETADNAGSEPVEPSLAVRLALAYLYSIANTDRRNFDQFWQTLRDPMKAEHSDVIRAYTRPTFCRTHLTGIARSVGIELTVDVWARLRRRRA